MIFGWRSSITFFLGLYMCFAMGAVVGADVAHNESMTTREASAALENVSENTTDSIRENNSGVVADAMVFVGRPLAIAAEEIAQYGIYVGAAVPPLARLIGYSIYPVAFGSLLYYMHRRWRFA